MSRKQKLKVILVVLGVVLGLGLIFGIIAWIDYNQDLYEDGDDYDYFMEDESFDGIVEVNDKLYELQHDVKTYLIIGTDASGNEEAHGEDYQGSMADFILLLVVDEEEKQYGYIQLNRDTMMDVPILNDDGSANASAYEQLCTAHWYGKDKKASCKNTANAITELLGGMPVNGYYALSLNSMEALNHAIGGVEVTLEDDLTHFDKSMKKGKTIKLSDEQAAVYMRSRMDVGNGDNESRMRRQRTYMNAVMDKMKNEVKNSSKFVAKVYNEMEPYSTSSISGKEVNKLAKSVGKMQDLGLYTPEGEAGEGFSLDDGIPHAEFTMDASSLEEIMLTLYPLEPYEE